VAETKLIVNLTRGDALCVSELADRPLRHIRGLIGHRGLPAGEGLLLSPAPGIHTAFVRFPIDALFLDRNLRVLDIVERLRPWRVASKRRARAVLELSAGECARRGVKVGDRLELRDRDPGDVARFNGSDMGDARRSDRGAASAQQRRAGEPARLQPLGVLVVSHDRHFLTVMSLLLARRNCSVTTTANANRVTELVARKSADVVVIDVSELPAAATLTKLEALAWPVGVVVVADEDHAGLSEPPMLAKWGPFEDFIEAIDWANQRRTTLVER
jgi:hypothetical protein